MTVRVDSRASLAISETTTLLSKTHGCVLIIQVYNSYEHVKRKDIHNENGICKINNGNMVLFNIYSACNYILILKQPPHLTRFNSITIQVTSWIPVIRKPLTYRDTYCSRCSVGPCPFFRVTSLLYTYYTVAGYPASLETLSPGLSPSPSLVPLSPLSYSSLTSTLPPSDYPASLRITAKHDILFKP